MRRPDRHNEIELNLLKHGTLTYMFGGERVTVAHGQLYAFWAAIPHQIISSTDDPHYYVLTLPLSWVLEFQLPPNLLDCLMHGQFLCDTTPERYNFDQQLFQTWIADLTDKKSNVTEAAIRLELHARLLRLAEVVPKPVQHRKRSAAVLSEAGLSKAEQLAAYIARHYLQPMRVEEAAAAVNLHPNYAMSLFKRTFNLTINEYVNQHRLYHAQRLLATTDNKVIDVALEAGYSTLSRFYDAFKKACGCSPSTYRNQHRSRVR